MPQANPVVANHIANIRLLKGFCHRVLSGDVPADALTHQAYADGSHILWLMGHIAWSIDRGTTPYFGGTPELEGYTELFGMGSKPKSDAHAYPTPEALRGAIDTACDGLARALESHTDESLERPLPPESPLANFFPSIGALVGFTLFHSGYHLGQISLLRRAQGLPSGVGM